MRNKRALFTALIISAFALTGCSSPESSSSSSESASPSSSQSASESTGSDQPKQAELPPQCDAVDQAIKANGTVTGQDLSLCIMGAMTIGDTATVTRTIDGAQIYTGQYNMANDFMTTGADHEYLSSGDMVWHKCQNSWIDITDPNTDDPCATLMTQVGVPMAMLTASTAAAMCDWQFTGTATENGQESVTFKSVPAAESDTPHTLWLTTDYLPLKLQTDATADSPSVMDTTWSNWGDKIDIPSAPPQ